MHWLVICYMSSVASECANIMPSMRCAERHTHAAAKQTASAASQAASNLPAAAAADGPVKTKAKKVPRYVKEALKEIEQEKAIKLASTRTQALPHVNVQKPAKAAKVGKAVMRQSHKSNKPAKKSKLAT